MSLTPQENIARLQTENEQLKNDCEAQRGSLEALEYMFAEANKKQLHAELSCMELEHIFASVTDAIWVIREDGIIIRANDAMLDMLALPVEEVVGHNCNELLNYQLCHTNDCPLKIAQEQEKREYDICMPSSSGIEHHYILNAAPMATIIGTTAIICQFKNITPRKEAEQKLEEANSALSKMARLDGLTQIANRRCFDETIEREWKRLLRSKKTLALILIDIDFFKKYNDFYGHQAGDECLKKVAKALEETVLRPADLVARYGGEEFVLLLPEIDLDGAEHVGKRVIEKVNALQIAHQASDVATVVTLSMGAAMMSPDDKKDFSELIAAADEALYQAKESGRNKIITAR